MLSFSYRALDREGKEFRGRVDDAVEGLTSLLEPLLMVGLGFVIGFIVIALYMPIINPTIFVQP